MKFPVHKCVMAATVPIRTYLLGWVRRTESWDQERIAHYQQKKFQKMISYCWKYIPFYRSLWSSCISDPRDIKSQKDLQELPIVTKTQFRSEIKNIMTTAPWIRSNSGRTGGSTGQPIQYRMTRYEEELAWAQLYNGWARAGYRLGDPFLVVGGESIGVGLGDNRTWKDAIINRWLSSGSNITIERTEALVKSPHFSRICFVYGYPNAIRELGERLYQLGVKFPSLKGVVCTAEVMLPETRMRIEETLGGVSVLDQYGLNDGAIHACEGIEQDGLHVSFHRAILEIVDDYNTPIENLNVSGRVLATALVNRATPFVRYETGDIAHWHSRQPSLSGVTWVRMGPVDGRTGDVIYLPSGRAIAMPGLTLVMRWMEGLTRYQFIQTGPNTVTVRLERGSGYNMSEQETVNFLRNRIAREIDWTVVWAPPELTSHRKFLIVRNDWLRAQGAIRPPEESRVF